MLDYGIGNLRSAEKALAHLGADAVLTNDVDVIRDSAAAVLPGVGAFGRCMQELHAHGLDVVAREAVASGRPFLGICVGMQMLFEASEEAPGVTGLGVIAGTVQRLGGSVTIPHMGWNTVDARSGSALFAGVPAPHWCYFVHSYVPVPAVSDVVSATTDHGGTIVAAVEQGAVWATQFHPEKSGPCGLAVLANFVAAATRSQESI